MHAVEEPVGGDLPIKRHSAQLSDLRVVSRCQTRILLGDNRCHQRNSSSATDIQILCVRLQPRRREGEGKREREEEGLEGGREGGREAGGDKPAPLYGKAISERNGEASRRNFYGGLALKASPGPIR